MTYDATYADLGERAAFERRACEALGLDPEETTELRIEVVPGRGAVVTWEGRRRIPLEGVADLLERTAGGGQ